MQINEKNHHANHNNITILNTYPKQNRLLTPKQYQQIFNLSDTKIHSAHLLLLIKKNDIKCARLGLTITKKKLKLAVWRNTLKRCTKEKFRMQKQKIGCIDCVLVVKKTPMDKTNLKILWHNELTILFKKLEDISI